LHYDLNGKPHPTSDELPPKYKNDSGGESKHTGTYNSHFAARYVAEPRDWHVKLHRYGTQSYRCRACGTPRITDRFFHDKYAHPEGPSPFDDPVTIQKMYETVKELFT